MLIQDIIAEIEKMAPPECQAEWDKSGPQIASLRKETDKMAVCLDPLPENIETALANGAGFLLSHHPLALKPGLPSKVDSLFMALKYALGGDLFLYAAHTSLDVNPVGPAGWLGRELGLQSRHVLEAAECEGERGYGGVGELPEPADLDSLLKKILELLGLAEGSLCGARPADKIRKVAWCGGSGASLIQKAAAMGAELFVTGDVKYHAALETPIPVLDVGHHSYEEAMMKRMAAVLSRRLPDLAVIFLPSSSPFVTIRA